MITIVSGFQRCGTSLVLQMLKAGGMDVYHDPDTDYPAYENAAQMSGGDFSWLNNIDGKALKWLEPQTYVPPEKFPFDIRVLWMRRDPLEQARSTVKFLTQVAGFDVPLSMVHEFQKSYAEDTPKAAEIWHARRAKFHMISFESLIEAPETMSITINKICGGGLNEQAMARQVRKRSPRCLPYLLETELMAQGDLA